MFSMYGKCPICGLPHDDGVYFPLNDKVHFIDFDCYESMGEEKVKERLIELEEKR